MLYFAYGSNMFTRRICSRVTSARPIGRAYLGDKKLLFNKRSLDGSGKSNLVDSPGDLTWGVLYEIDVEGLATLDEIEHGYDRIWVQVRDCKGNVFKAVTYVSADLTSDPAAHGWYKELVLAGAREHNLPKDYVAYLERLPSRPRN